MEPNFSFLLPMAAFDFSIHLFQLTPQEKRIPRVNLSGRVETGTWGTQDTIILRYCNIFNSPYILFQRLSQPHSFFQAKNEKGR